MNNSFLIIRLSSLGDIIHTLPSFSLLRNNFPNARISWIVEKKGYEILKFVPNLNETIIINSNEWKKNLFSLKCWKDIFKFKNKIKNNYEYAIDFQGLVKSGLISYLSRAKNRFGFHKKNLKEPFASIFYNCLLPEIDESMHVIKKNVKLLTLLNINEEKIEFPLEIPPEITLSIEKILKNSGYDFKKKLILLNVGAGWETKRWDIENFIKLARMLKRENNFLLFLWGTETEKELAIKSCKETGIPILPFLSIPELMALILKASLLISGDSFPLHFASAFSIPVVGIFGPTDPQRNGPIRSHDKVAFYKLSCSFCYKRKCQTMDCIKRITPEEIFELASQILNGN